MANVVNRSCLHDSCTMSPSFNIDRTKAPAYCKQHAGCGMISVYGRRCLHDPCTKSPSFNIEGTKTAAYCMKHAEHGMVDVRSKRCSHVGCRTRPGWGLLTKRGATACLRHTGDILSGLVINSRALCKVKGCARISRWGIEGQQPTYCMVHGPLEVELVRTIGRTKSVRSGRDPSYGTVRGPPSNDKTECFF